MNNKRKVSTWALGLTVLLSVAVPEQAQERKKTAPGTQPVRGSAGAPNKGAEAEKYRRAIEADPDSAEAHADFIQQIEMEQRAAAPGQEHQPEEKAKADIVAQYEAWSRQYPDKAAFPCQLGKYLERKDPKRAEQYYQTALKRNPKYGEAWRGLATLADARGDDRANLDYMRKAAEAEPGNASNLLLYAAVLREDNPSKARDLFLQVANKFPGSDEAASALSNLAGIASNLNEKIEYLERLKREYPPQKSPSSAYSLGMLFEAYNKLDPAKALAFAREMQAINAREWEPVVTYQQSILDARKLIADRKISEALELLGGLKGVRRYYIDAVQPELLKLEAMKASGNAAQAYEGLLALEAREPRPALRAELLKLAAGLNKSSEQVTSDLWKLRDKTATVAPDFSLRNVANDKTYTLADFKGHVVLLNFWYLH